jgi:hypothetical protein
MNPSFTNVFTALWLSLLLGVLVFSPPSYADEQSSENNAQVIQAFTPKVGDQSKVIPVESKTKKIVMFSMGVPLLVLLLVTGVLGIAMGVYGKQVFVAHMIFAGLSLTLAIAHTVVGLVWFFPF